MELSLEKRFDIQKIAGIFYAPFSLGSPSELMATDRKEFEKTDDEKGKLFTMKRKVPKARGHKFITLFKGSF